MITHHKARTQVLDSIPISLRLDQDFKRLCPALLPEELTRLETNLATDGCRDRIVVWNEPDGDWLIADGHNRFEICTRLNITFSVTGLLLTDRDEVRLWIMENQFGRRNLTDGARALLAVEYKKTQEAIAKKRMEEAGKFGVLGKESGVLGGRPKNEENPPVTMLTQGGYSPDDEPDEPDADEPAKSITIFVAKKHGQQTADKPPKDSAKNTNKRAPTARAIAAKQAGVSEGTLSKTEYIVEKADKDVIAKLEKGKTNINREYKKLKSEETKIENNQRMAVALASIESTELTIRHCSMQELLSKLEAQSVDAIITDPPYAKEFLPLYADLARLAKPLLKPTGVLAVMCGQNFLPEILALMTPHIEYRWTVSYLMPGGQAVQFFKHKLNSFWKPVLLFGGRSSWMSDVVKSEPNDNDKRFHGWGQSESGMRDLVERLTEPADLVVDPFAGGGTTGVVCAVLGRRFLGCDIDGETVKLANARILDTINNAESIGNDKEIP